MEIYGISIEVYFTLVVIGLFVLQRLFTVFGWTKGVLILDELRAGMDDAMKYIIRFKTNGQSQLDLNKAAGTIAKKVPGVTEDDVKALVLALAHDKEYHAGGIKLTMDTTGTVDIDPSGFLSQKAYKVSKWFKKIF